MERHRVVVERTEALAHECDRAFPRHLRLASRPCASARAKDDEPIVAQLLERMAHGVFSGAEAASKVADRRQRRADTQCAG
jgi:hypothetical protein